MHSKWAEWNIRGTPLIEAAVAGDKALEVARVLLKKGADPNDRCLGRYPTALEAAVWQGADARNVVHLLQEFGARVDVQALLNFSVKEEYRRHIPYLNLERKKSLMCAAGVLETEEALPVLPENSSRNLTIQHIKRKISSVSDDDDDDMVDLPEYLDEDIGHTSAGAFIHSDSGIMREMVSRQNPKHLSVAVRSLSGLGPVRPGTLAHRVKRDKGEEREGAKDNLSDSSGVD